MKRNTPKVRTEQAEQSPPASPRPDYLGDMPVPRIGQIVIDDGIAGPVIATYPAATKGPTADPLVLYRDVYGQVRSQYTHALEWDDDAPIAAATPEAATDAATILRAGIIDAIGTDGDGSEPESDFKLIARLASRIGDEIDADERADRWLKCGTEALKLLPKEYATGETIFAKIINGITALTATVKPKTQAEKDLTELRTQICIALGVFDRVANEPSDAELMGILKRQLASDRQQHLHRRLGMGLKRHDPRDSHKGGPVDVLVLLELAHRLAWDVSVLRDKESKMVSVGEMTSDCYDDAIISELYRHANAASNTLLELIESCFMNNLAEIAVGDKPNQLFDKGGAVES